MTRPRLRSVPRLARLTAAPALARLTAAPALALSLAVGATACTGNEDGPATANEPTPVDLREATEYTSTSAYASTLLAALEIYRFDNSGVPDDLAAETLVDLGLPVATNATVAAYDPIEPEQDGGLWHFTVCVTATDDPDTFSFVDSREAEVASGSDGSCDPESASTAAEGDDEPSQPTAAEGDDRTSEERLRDLKQADDAGFEFLNSATLFAAAPETRGGEPIYPESSTGIPVPGDAVLSDYEAPREGGLRFCLTLPSGAWAAYDSTPGPDQSRTLMSSPVGECFDEPLAGDAG